MLHEGKFYFSLCDCLVFFCTDYEQLKLRGNRNNFGGVCLSFYKLGPTDTILVENIAENIPELEDYLKYHFQKFTGPDSIDSVTVMTGNKALIKFYTCESKSYVVK